MWFAMLVAFGAGYAAHKYQFFQKSWAKAKEYWAKRNDG